LLDALATRVLHFGPVPGTVTAAVNLIGAVQIASAAEGLARAERAGLTPRRRALATSQAASPQVAATRRMAKANSGDIPFTRVRLKDIDYALRLADTLGVAAPFGAAAREAFARLIALGGAADHESRVIEVARATPRKLP
jgi:3-hydroxyisobutyrate dehydrogenase